jgi:hypothetical protein
MNTYIITYTDNKTVEFKGDGYTYAPSHMEIYKQVQNSGVIQMSESSKEVVAMIPWYNVKYIEVD